jgi:hypothetical protein
MKRYAGSRRHNDHNQRKLAVVENLNELDTPHERRWELAFRKPDATKGALKHACTFSGGVMLARLHRGRERERNNGKQGRRGWERSGDTGYRIPPASVGRRHQALPACESYVHKARRAHRRGIRGGAIRGRNRACAIMWRRGWTSSNVGGSDLLSRT